MNFAPVIVYDGWQREYADLFTLLNDTLSPAAKAQMAAEVAFLTHNAELHEVNLRWHPKAEEWLWRPELQEEKSFRHGRAQSALSPRFEARVGGGVPRPARGTHAILRHPLRILIIHA